ncbi:MAG: sugar phosphate isomerase/epimerase [Ruminococcaceae bacterium]|nr:sugar phosphate isomerase/epimerase [Oscillospiraceae bacterium]
MKKGSIMMKFGMPTLMEFNGVEESARLCAELGLNFVEICMSLPQYTLEAIDVERFRDIGKRYGVKFTVHLDENVNFCDFNKKIADACFDYIISSAQMADRLGCKLINMHFHRGEHFTMPNGKVDLFSVYRDRYISRIMEFRTYCEAALKDAGVKICIENCKGYTDFQRDALNILLASPVFGLTYDIGHSHRADYVDESFIIENRNKLFHMHLHDADSKNDHLALGTGEIDKEKYLRLASECGCTVVLETKTSVGLRESVNWVRNNTLNN